MRAPVPRCLLADLVRDCPKRELAQRREVPLAEEVRQRPFDLLGPVDLPFAQAVPQLLDSHVDVDDLVRPIQIQRG